MTQRPASVTFAAIMMFIGSVGYAAGVVINLVMLFNPGEQQLLFGSTVTDWYWIINGGLDAVLVVGFIWMARVKRGSSRCKQPATSTSSSSVTSPK